MNKEVYIIIAYGGEYEDKWERIVKVFIDKDKATTWMNSQKELSEKYSKLVPMYVNVYDAIFKNEERRIRKELKQETNENIWYDVPMPQDEDKFIELYKKYHIKSPLNEEDLRIFFNAIGENTEDYDDYGFPYYSMETHTIDD